MTGFVDYLLRNADGLRVIIDQRAEHRPAPVPRTVKVSASGAVGKPARDLIGLVNAANVPTAYIARSGSIIVLSIHGDGRIVYEAVKGSPSAVQARGIAAVENALAVARGDVPNARPAESEPEVDAFVETVIVDAADVPAEPGE